MSKILFDLSGKIDHLTVAALLAVKSIADSCGIPFFVVGVKGGHPVISTIVLIFLNSIIWQAPRVEDREHSTTKGVRACALKMTGNRAVCCPSVTPDLFQIYSDGMTEENSSKRCTLEPIWNQISKMRLASELRLFVSY
jgi:hypothetical protein